MPFMSPVDKNFGTIELEIPMYNINKGMNEDLLSRSEKLKYYAEFIAKKREFMALHTDYDLAVKKAVDYCIRNGILAEFLKEHGGRIVSILGTEFKISDAAKVWKEEGMEAGIVVGRETAQLEIARRMLSMNIAVQDVIKATGLSAAQIIQLDSVELHKQGHMLHIT